MERGTSFFIYTITMFCKGFLFYFLDSCLGYQKSRPLQYTCTCVCVTPKHTVYQLIHTHTQTTARLPRASEDVVGPLGLTHHHGALSSLFVDFEREHLPSATFPDNPDTNQAPYLPCRRFPAVGNVHQGVEPVSSVSRASTAFTTFHC